MIFISLITILTDFLQPRNQGIEQSTIQCISFAVPPRSSESVCDMPLPIYRLFIGDSFMVGVVLFRCNGL